MANPVCGVTSHPSGKQWAAVRTQHAEIRLPLQRKMLPLLLLLQKIAATHGWDSTVAMVPPTIFICFFLVRRPQVEPMARKQKQLECSSEGKGLECTKRPCYLAAGHLVWAKVRLEAEHWNGLSIEEETFWVRWKQKKLPYRSQSHIAEYCSTPTAAGDSSWRNTMGVVCSVDFWRKYEKPNTAEVC